MELWTQIKTVWKLGIKGKYNAILQLPYQLLAGLCHFSVPISSGSADSKKLLMLCSSWWSSAISSSSQVVLRTVWSENAYNLKLTDFGAL